MPDGMRKNKLFSIQYVRLGLFGRLSYSKMMLRRPVVIYDMTSALSAIRKHCHPLFCVL